MALTKVKLVADGVIDVDHLAANHGITTTNIGEGTALYYTDARVQSYLTTNSYATEGFVTTAVSDLVASAPSTLDTLNELAAALGDDPNFATTVTNSIAGKLPLAGGTLTGGLHINTTSLPQLLIQNADGGTNAERIAIELNAGDVFKIRSLNDNNTTRVDNIITANILTGNVGIGTTTPSAKLEVNGYTAVGTYAAPHYSQSGMAYQVIKATSGSNSQRALLELHSGASGTKAYMQAVGGNNTVYIGSLTNSGVIVGNDVVSMAFNTAGNVGIGTTSPTGKLNIQQSSLNTAALFIGRYNAEDSPIIQIGESTSFSGSGAYGEALIASRNRDIVFSTGDFQSLSSVNTAAMIIEKGEGNVGIGTTSPTSYGATARTLEVRGVSGNGVGLLRVSTGDNTVGTSLYSSGSAGVLNVQTNHPLIFSTNNSEKVRLLTNGNLGIGTTSPSQRLSVEGGSIKLNNNNADANYYLWLNKKEGRDGGILIQRDNTLDWQITNLNTTGNLNFYSYGTSSSVLLINKSNGNVGIGTDNPKALLDIGKNAGADPSPVDSPVTLRLTDLGNAATGSGDTTNPWAEIQFYSEDASSGGPAVQAKIATIYDDVYSAGSHIAFYNTATPTNGLSERMRIHANGDITFCKSTTSVDTNGVFIQAVNDGAVYSSLGSPYNTYHVYNTLNDRYDFYVSYNGTIYARDVTIQSLSDERLKENIQDLTGSLDTITSLRPRTFDFKDGSKINSKGFVAQEVEQVLPECVKEFTAGDPLEDGTRYKTVGQDFMPYIVGAIKELKEIIDGQQQEINDLKDQLNG